MKAENRLVTDFLFQLLYKVGSRWESEPRTLLDYGGENHLVHR